MSCFKGDIDSLIEEFSFKKQDQTEVENSMYEVYELDINKRIKVGLEVYHFLDDNNIIFSLNVKGFESRIKIYSSIDLRNFIKYF